MKIPPAADESIYNFHYGFANGDTLYTYWEVFVDQLSVSNSTGDYNECLGRLSTHQTSENLGNLTITDSSLYANIGTIQRSYGYMSGAKLIGTLIDYHLEE